MKKCRFLFLTGAFLCALSSTAFANGLNLNSLGSKALAMGGAFVGLADDFSAIYWNPAGITNFNKKYYGFYGVDIIPNGSYKSSLVDAKTETRHFLSGLVAYYHPFSEKIVAGLGVYIPSGLGAGWPGADFEPISMGAEYVWSSRIGLVTIAPALGFRINDWISFGVSLNINYGTFSLKMHAGAMDNPSPPPDQVDLGQYEESMNGWGYGATLGILAKPLERLSLGATLRTASSVKLNGEASISNLSYLGYNSTSDLERDLTWPMWIGAGAAYKAMENLTLTADLQWTQWSRIDVVETRFQDDFWQIMMAQSDNDQKPFHWEDTLQVRLGAEYRTEKFNFRGGFYIDPSPAPDRTMTVLIPSYDYNVVTLGLGYNLNGLQLDFGLEYLMGKNRTVPADRVANDPEWRSAMEGTYSMKVVVPNISISYKF